MTEKQTFLIDNATERSVCYRFFSGFFASSRSEALLELLPSVADFVGEECAVAFGKEIEINPAETQAAGNALEIEFAKLFYGVKENNIPLSESAYTSEAGLMCQGAWKSIQAFYAKNGFSVEPERDQEADSLSMELMFASMLVETNPAGDELKELLDAHLTSFARSVANEIIKETQNPTLLCVAQCLKGFVQAEQALLG